MSGSKAKNEEIDDRVSADFLLGKGDALFEKFSVRMMKDEDYRQRVIAIINEQVGSVDFMKKVREYAGMEIDSRLFTSVKYWIVVILSAIATSGVAIALTRYFSK